MEFKLKRYISALCLSLCLSLSLCLTLCLALSLALARSLALFQPSNTYKNCPLELRSCCLRTRVEILFYIVRQPSSDPAADLSI